MGFETDFVTGFVDRPLIWTGVWWKPWTWFDWVRIDLREAAWYHDLRYFLGWNVPRDFPLIALAKAKPLHNRQRSDLIRSIIDHQLERDFIREGFPPRIAKAVTNYIMPVLGNSHYYWANDESLRMRKLD